VITHYLKIFLNGESILFFYENDNCGWIHIYSLPWPSSKEDKRQLPVVKDGYNRSVRSDVEQYEYIKDVTITTVNQLIELKRHFRRVCQITTRLPIDIQLPLRISKLILTKETRKKLFYQRKSIKKVDLDFRFIFDK
jgi:hypothetical protein